MRFLDVDFVRKDRPTVRPLDEVMPPELASVSPRDS